MKPQIVQVPSIKALPHSLARIRQKGGFRTTSWMSSACVSLVAFTARPKRGKLPANEPGQVTRS